MRTESANPYCLVDEWEIAAVTRTKTHTTLHPVPVEGVQQGSIQLEGVYEFEVGATVRFTVEEIPAVVLVPGGTPGDTPTVPTEMSARPRGRTAAARGPTRS